MDEIDKALFYIFFLSLVLVLVAYYLGTRQVLDSLFAGVTGLINTATGRNASGQFAAYPSA